MDNKDISAVGICEDFMVFLKLDLFWVQVLAWMLDGVKIFIRQE